MPGSWYDVGGGSSGEDGWLYRIDGEVHGPVPQQAIVNKLLTGKITADTPVAVEGGEFHPLRQFSTFAAHVEKTVEVQRSRRAVDGKRVRLAFVVPLAVVCLGAGAYFYRTLAWQEAEVPEPRRDPGFALVPLSFAAERVQVRSQQEKQKQKRSGRKKGKRSRGIAECRRDGAEIASVLNDHAAKLRRCIAGNALSGVEVLNFDFVIKPGGKVTGFEIQDRHHRSGPFASCAAYVFARIKYPPLGGSACAVSIPLTIRR